MSVSRPWSTKCHTSPSYELCGLMIGLELTIDGAPIVSQCLERGLLINCTQQTVIRLLPAMTLTDEQLDEGCEILADVMRNYQGRGQGSGEQNVR